MKSRNTTLKTEQTSSLNKVSSEVHIAQPASSKSKDDLRRPTTAVRKPPSQSRQSKDSERSIVNIITNPERDQESVRYQNVREVMEETFQKRKTRAGQTKSTLKLKLKLKRPALRNKSNASPSIPSQNTKKQRNFRKKCLPKNIDIEAEENLELEVKPQIRTTKGGDERNGIGLTESVSTARKPQSIKRPKTGGRNMSFECGQEKTVNNKIYHTNAVNSGDDTYAPTIDTKPTQTIQSRTALLLASPKQGYDLGKEKEQGGRVAGSYRDSMSQGVLTLELNDDEARNEITPRQSTVSNTINMAAAKVIDIFSTLNEKPSNTIEQGCIEFPIQTGINLQVPTQEPVQSAKEATENYLLGTINNERPTQKTILKQDQKRELSPLTSVSNVTLTSQHPQMTLMEQLSAEGFLANWERTVHTSEPPVRIQKDCHGSYNQESMHLATWYLHQFNFMLEIQQQRLEELLRQAHTQVMLLKIWKLAIQSAVECCTDWQDTPVLMMPRSKFVELLVSVQMCLLRVDREYVYNYLHDIAKTQQIHHIKRESVLMRMIKLQPRSKNLNAQPPTEIELPQKISQGFLYMPEGNSLRDSNKKKIQGKPTGAEHAGSNEVDFKEFVHSVYSLYGTYLRLLSQDAIDNQMRQVFDMLKIVRHPTQQAKKSRYGNKRVQVLIKTLPQLALELEFESKRAVLDHRTSDTSPTKGPVDQEMRKDQLNKLIQQETWTDRDAIQACQTFEAYNKAKEQAKFASCQIEAVKNIQNWYVEAQGGYVFAHEEQLKLPKQPTAPKLDDSSSVGKLTGRHRERRGMNDVSDPQFLLGRTEPIDFLKHASLKSSIPEIQQMRRDNTFRVRKTATQSNGLSKTDPGTGVNSLTSFGLKTASQSPIRTLRKAIPGGEGTVTVKQFKEIPYTGEPVTPCTKMLSLNVSPRTHLSQKMLTLANVNSGMLPGQRNSQGQLASQKSIYPHTDRHACTGKDFVGLRSQASDSELEQMLSARQHGPGASPKADEKLIYSGQLLLKHNETQMSIVKEKTHDTTVETQHLNDDLQVLQQFKAGLIAALTPTGTRMQDALPIEPLEHQNTEELPHQKDQSIEPQGYSADSSTLAKQSINLKLQQAAEQGHTLIQFSANNHSVTQSKKDILVGKWEPRKRQVQYHPDKTVLSTRLGDKYGEHIFKEQDDENRFRFRRRSSQRGPEIPTGTGRRLLSGNMNRMQIGETIEQCRYMPENRSSCIKYIKTSNSQTPSHAGTRHVTVHENRSDNAHNDLIEKALKESQERIKSKANTMSSLMLQKRCSSKNLGRQDTGMSEAMKAGLATRLKATYSHLQLKPDTRNEMNASSSNGMMSTSNTRMTTMMRGQTRNGQMQTLDQTHSYKNLLNRNSHLSVSGGLHGQKGIRQSLLGATESNNSSLALKGEEASIALQYPLPPKSKRPWTSKIYAKRKLIKRQEQSDTTLIYERDESISGDSPEPTPADPRNQPFKLVQERSESEYTKSITSTDALTAKLRRNDLSPGTQGRQTATPNYDLVQIPIPQVVMKQL